MNRYTTAVSAAEAFAEDLLASYLQHNSLDSETCSTHYRITPWGDDGPDAQHFEITLVRNTKELRAAYITVAKATKIWYVQTAGV